MKKLFSLIAFVLTISIGLLAFCGIAQAATPGIYNMVNAGVVLDVSNVKSVSQYNSNNIRVNFADGSSAVYGDTGLVVFNKIKLEPGFFYFAGATTIVNMRAARLATPYNSNNTSIYWQSGGYDVLSDTGGAVYAAIQAQSN